MVARARAGILDSRFANARGAASVLAAAVLVCGCTRASASDANASGGAATAAAEQAAMTNEKAAQVAAEAWLALVDAGSYSQSWTEAAAFFRKAIDQPGWEKALNGVRAPLGKLLSRTLKSAKHATSLPGAPDGEYVVLQFDASFENKKSAIETVTPVKEADGRWRVTGYFIK